MLKKTISLKERMDALKNRMGSWIVFLEKLKSNDEDGMIQIYQAFQQELKDVFTNKDYTDLIQAILTKPIQNYVFKQCNDNGEKKVVKKKISFLVFIIYGIEKVMPLNLLLDALIEQNIISGKILSDMAEVIFKHGHIGHLSVFVEAIQKINKNKNDKLYDVNQLKWQLIQMIFKQESSYANMLAQLDSLEPSLKLDKKVSHAAILMAIINSDLKELEESLKNEYTGDMKKCHITSTKYAALFNMAILFSRGKKNQSIIEPLKIIHGFFKDCQGFQKENDRVCETHFKKIEFYSNDIAPFVTILEELSSNSKEFIKKQSSNFKLYHAILTENQSEYNKLIEYYAFLNINTIVAVTHPLLAVKNIKFIEKYIEVVKKTNNGDVIQHHFCKWLILLPHVTIDKKIQLLKILFDNGFDYNLSMKGYCTPLQNILFLNTNIKHIEFFGYSYQAGKQNMVSPVYFLDGNLTKINLPFAKKVLDLESVKDLNWEDQYNDLPLVNQLFCYQKLQKIHCFTKKSIAWSKLIELLLMLIKHEKIDVNKINAFNAEHHFITSMELAISIGEPKLINALLNKGYSFFTLRLFSAFMSNKNFSDMDKETWLKIFISHGLDLSKEEITSVPLPGKKEVTATEFAIARFSSMLSAIQVEALWVLPILANSIDFNEPIKLTTNYGDIIEETPFRAAIRCGIQSESFLKELVKYGANIFARVRKNDENIILFTLKHDCSNDKALVYILKVMDDMAPEDTLVILKEIIKFMYAKKNYFTEKRIKLLVEHMGRAIEKATQSFEEILYYFLGELAFYDNLVSVYLNNKEGNEPNIIAYELAQPLIKKIENRLFLFEINKEVNQLITKEKDLKELINDNINLPEINNITYEIVVEKLHVLIRDVMKRQSDSISAIWLHNMVSFRNLLVDYFAVLMSKEKINQKFLDNMAECIDAATQQINNAVKNKSVLDVSSCELYKILTTGKENLVLDISLFHKLFHSFGFAKANILSEQKNQVLNYSVWSDFESIKVGQLLKNYFTDLEINLENWQCNIILNKTDLFSLAKLNLPNKKIINNGLLPTLNIVQQLPDKIEQFKTNHYNLSFGSFNIIIKCINYISNDDRSKSVKEIKWLIKSTRNLSMHAKYFLITDKVKEVISNAIPKSKDVYKELMLKYGSENNMNNSNSFYSEMIQSENKKNKKTHIQEKRV